MWCKRTYLLESLEEEYIKIMDHELSEEDVARIAATHPHNLREHLRRVRRLLRSAQKGNIPYGILEDEYGFQGDYKSGDWG